MDFIHSKLIENGPNNYFKIKKKLKISQFFSQQRLFYLQNASNLYYLKFKCSLISFAATAVPF